jgi:hypothetical protein
MGVSLAEAEPPDKLEKGSTPPLLLNGTSQFIEIDTLAAIALVGFRLQGGAAPGHHRTGKLDNQQLGSDRHHVRLSDVCN